MKNVIGKFRISISRSPFSQWIGSGTYLHQPPKNGPHTTRNTNTNLQFHRNRHCKEYNSPKIIKIHRYSPLLDLILNQTRPFTCLLEARNEKPGILFYQASNATTPHINTANISLSPYRGYHIESFCKGVFITHSYRKARQLQ